MKDLIEALTIFAKYANVVCPTHCEHDVLMIMAVDRAAMTADDIARVETLGFYWSEGDFDCWQSYRFGSA